MQTFVTIWWLKIPKTSIAFSIVSVQWLFVILFVSVGFRVHTHPPTEYYATPTPVCHSHELPALFTANTLWEQYWCWLGKKFTKERIAGEYFWFWLTLGVSIILYFLLFLLNLGVIRPGASWYAPTDFTRNRLARANGSAELNGPAEHHELDVIGPGAPADHEPTDLNSTKHSRTIWAPLV